MHGDNRGFTLVEVMVVSVISAVILMTVASLFVTGVKLRIKSENERDAQVASQKALFMISNGEKGGDRPGIRQAVEVVYGTNYVALAAYDPADTLQAYTYYRNTSDNKLYFQKTSYSPPLSGATTGGDAVLSNVSSFNVYTPGSNKYVVQLNTSVTGVVLNRNINLNTEIIPRNTLIREKGSDLLNTKAGCPDIVENFMYTPGPGRVTLTWDPCTSPNLSGYNVYYKLSTAGSYTKWNSSWITAQTVTITGLTPGTLYYFTIEAGAAGNTSFKTFTYGKPN